MTYSVALPDRLDFELQRHLLRSLPDDEDVTFALWHPSAGEKRFTALLRSPILPAYGDRTQHGNVEIHAQYVERSIRIAIEQKAGLALLHSHPATGWQSMSKDDHDAEAKLASSVKAATGQPLVGLTLGMDSAWSARFWQRSVPRTYKPHWCEGVRVVGQCLRVTYAPHLRPRPRFRPEMKRTVSAWGEAIQADLMRLRVGIVGAGSVGSMVAEAVARMGVQQVLLLDFDVVEDVNLDRLLHATSRDANARTPKVECLARALRKSATAGRFEVEPAQWSVVESEGFRKALDCDVLFSCVDRPWGRSALNGIAYAHLIPVVDGGVLVTTKHGGKALRHADWRAHVVAPGRPCLECLGQYQPGEPTLERDGYLDDPVYIDGLSLGHRLRRNENVFAFSMATASLQVLQALSMIVAPSGIANVGAQMYHFVNGRMDVEELRNCDERCPYPAFVARGADAPVSWVGRHIAAERRRSQAGAVKVAPVTGPLGRINKRSGIGDGSPAYRRDGRTVGRRSAPR